MATPQGEAPIGTGLVPPRIDQAPRPSPPRLIAPGSPNVVKARLVIISGTSGSGLFVYSPNPGPGNLVASIAPQAGTDGFGNAYPAGLAVFDDIGDIINLVDGEILLSSPAGLLREITPTADLIYTPAAAEGTLTAALASQAGVDDFGNTFLQGLTADAGQLTGQVIAASVFEGVNLRFDDHGIFLYQAQAAAASIAVTTAAVTPSIPYFVGHNAVGGGGGTTMVVTVTNGTTAGDYLYLSAESIVGGSSVSNVIDSKGNLYTKQPGSATAGIPMSIWTSPGTAALVPGDTITLTYGTSAGAKNATVAGIPALPASPIDNVPAMTTGTSAAPSVTSGTLAQANEVVLATIGDQNAGGAPTWAGGWTPIDTNHRPASSDPFISIAYQVVSSTSPVTASGTITSATWTAGLVSFKAGTAVASTVLVPLAAAPLIPAPPLPYVIGGNIAAAGVGTVVITLAAGISTTAGDVIYVAGAGDGTDLPQTVIDSKGNGYTLVESNNTPTEMSTWQAGASGTPTVALAPGDTITLTYTGTTGTKAVSAIGIPNLPASSLDPSNFGGVTGGTSTAPNSASFGLSEANEIIMITLAYPNGGGAAVTWTDGATQQLDQRHATAGVFLTTAYQAISGLPQVNIAATIGASVAWTLANANFKEV